MSNELEQKKDENNVEGNALPSPKEKSINLTKKSLSASKWWWWSFMPWVNFAAWVHAGFLSGNTTYFWYAGIYGIPMILMIIFEHTGLKDIPVGLAVISWIVGMIHVHFEKKRLGNKQSVGVMKMETEKQEKTKRIQQEEQGKSKKEQQEQMETLKKGAVAVYGCNYERGLLSYPDNIYDLVLIAREDRIIITDNQFKGRFHLDIPFQQITDIQPAAMEMGTIGRILTDTKDNEKLEHTDFNLIFETDDGLDRIVRFGMGDGFGDATKARHVDQMLEKIYPYRRKFKPIIQLASLPTNDINAKLEKLAELRQKGIIDEEEFKQKKKDLLAQL